MRITIEANIPENARIEPETVLQAIQRLGIEGTITETESNEEQAAKLNEKRKQITFDW